MVGATFRKNSDLPPNAFASFGLSRQPDWSFADGTPGYLVSSKVGEIAIVINSDFSPYTDTRVLPDTASKRAACEAQITQSSWQHTMLSSKYPMYSNAFSEQGAERSCGSHGGSDLAGAPGAPVHEQDEFDEWHRESRCLRMYVAETSPWIYQTEESLQFFDHQNSRRNNVVIYHIKRQRKVV